MRRWRGHRGGRLAVLLALTWVYASSGRASEIAAWPQFRGLGARGVADEGPLPEEWSAEKNVRWKTDIPGRGWSSPVVWGEHLFLTTAVNSGQSEPPKKGLYFGGNRPDAPKTSHQWKVLGLDMATGQVRWERTVHEGPPAGAIHLKNSYASETPVTDGERLYVYFGNVGLYCFDFAGNVLWSQRFDPCYIRFGWGTAASPVLHEDRIYVVNDNEDQSYLLALDKRTGKEIWRADRDEDSNWSTPYVWQNRERTEIVTPGSDKVRSYSLKGELLWWFSGMSSITIATPYAAGDLLYVSSGYVGDFLRRPLYAIRPGASGDISLEAKATSNSHIAWCDWKGGPYNPSTLVYQKRLYVLFDRGTLSCYDAATGKVIYDRQRLPDGNAFTSSPWAGQGKIYCLNEDGVTFVVAAEDKFQLLHTNRLAEDDMCMATPAVAGGRLLIRSAARVYCIGP